MKNLSNENKIKKIPIWLNISIILYLISFTKSFNLDFLKYISMIFIQIICLFDIKKNHIKINSKDILILLFLFFSMMFSFWSSTQFKLSIIKTFSIIDMIICTTILMPSVFKKYDKKALIKSIRNDILIVLFAYFIIFHNDYITRSNIGRKGKSLRYMFGFTHPNTLAIFAFIGICFNSYLLKISPKKSLDRKFNIVSLLFLLYLIYLTDSKTGIYSVLIFFALFFYDYVYSKLKDKHLVNISLVAAVLIGAVIVTKTYDLSLAKLNYILSNRLYLWSSAFNILISSNRLLIGLGSFTNSQTFATNNILIDNGYINYIYQFGLISFVILLIFWISTFKKIIPIKKKDLDYYIFLKNTFFCFLIYSFFENILINISSLFAILILMLIYTAEKEANDEDISNNTSI